MLRMRGGFRRDGSSRICGIGLMIAGLLLMMILVPRWAWAGILCACVIGVGFIIWRGGACC